MTAFDDQVGAITGSASAAPPTKETPHMELDYDIPHDTSLHSLAEIWNSTARIADIGCRCAAHPTKTDTETNIIHFCVNARIYREAADMVTKGCSRTELVEYATACMMDEWYNNPSIERTAAIATWESILQRIDNDTRRLNRAAERRNPEPRPESQISLSRRRRTFREWIFRDGKKQK